MEEEPKIGDYRIGEKDSYFWVELFDEQTHDGGKPFIRFFSCDRYGTPMGKTQLSTFNYTSLEAARNAIKCNFNTHTIYHKP